MEPEPEPGVGPEPEPGVGPEPEAAVLPTVAAEPAGDVEGRADPPVRPRPVWVRRTRRHRRLPRPIRPGRIGLHLFAPVPLDPEELLEPWWGEPDPTLGLTEEWDGYRGDHADLEGAVSDGTVFDGSPVRTAHPGPRRT